MAGFTGKIPAAGFSGTADTSWADGVRMMCVKSRDGAPCGGTRRRLRDTALRETGAVGPNSDKHCCIGLTIQEGSDAVSCQYHLRERVGCRNMYPPADAGGTDLRLAQVTDDRCLAAS